ncbi:MAG: 6-bladed beta-propeller [Bacteroidota bacterium]
MNYKKTFIVLLLLFTITWSYSQNQTKSVIEKLYLNPTYARGGIDTQIFKSISYIPLETTEESLFGEIYKLEITNDYYIISDRSTNSILLFQKDGKFYTKISGKIFSNGHVNEEFTVDRDQKLIITTISSIPGKLLWITYKGKIVREVSFKEPYNSIQNTNSSAVVYSPWTFLAKTIKKDSVNYFIKYLRNNRVDRKLLPYEVIQFATPANLMTTDMPRPYHFYYSGVEDNLLFVENYNYNIYALNSVGIEKIYNVVFPKDLSVSTDSLAKRTSMEEKEKYLKENKNKIYTFRGAYTIGNYLCFETIKWSFFNTDPYLLYNLKTRNLISLKKISSSISSSYLPLFSAFGSIIGSDNEYLYSTVSSLDMFQAKESTNSKQPKYSPLLQVYFNTQSRKSNPVIVQLQLKDN